MNDFVRRRYPGQPTVSSSSVRIITARKSSRCPRCSRLIVAQRSRIALVFGDQTWVHVACLSDLPDSRMPR